MITPMAKIRIIGPKTLLTEVTKLLQDLGVVHIESSPLYVESGRLKCLSLSPDHQKSKEESERMLKDLSSMVAILPETPGMEEASLIGEDLPSRKEDLRCRIRQAIDEVRPQIDLILEQIRQLEEENSLLAKYEYVLKALAPVLYQIQESGELDFIGLILTSPFSGSALGGGKESVLQEIHQALSELTAHQHEFFISRVDPETLVGLLVIPREQSVRVRTFLWKENISELRLPANVSDRPMEEALQILERRKVELPQQIEQSRASLRSLSHQWRGRLITYKKVIANWLAQLETAVSFYQTPSTFLVYGWIPDRDLPLLQQRLAEAFGGAAVMEMLSLSRGEFKNVPVALSNTFLVRPFQILTRLVALPRYGSIDPTPYLAFFFPLFFGIILGDIGYGAVLLGFSVFARRRWHSLERVRDLSSIFIIASVWTIFFGFLYGEFFGSMGERIGIHPILLNRMQEFLLLIGMALGLGLAHIFLGILLGMATSIRLGDTHKMAVQGSGLAALISFAVMLCALTGFIARFYTVVGGAMLFVSLFFLFALGGLRAAMELHNVVNVLSYLRIMGVGMASVALTHAAHTLAGLVNNAVLGAIIMLFLHSINLVFGVFSPTVQSLRLHYVEFFENFFQPGGREYLPFKKLSP